MKSKFLVLLLLTIIPTLGFAAVFGDFEYTTSKSGVTITMYNGASDTVEIPSTINNVPVRSIGDRAFYWMYLTSVTIPNSVTSIGEGAFSSCSGLASIDVDLRNLSYKSIDGVLFNKALTTIIAYPSRKSGSYVIPNSVKSIGKSAFSGCSDLTSVTIPNSVTFIGEGAFSSCTGLTSVTIPNSVTSIGEEAFSACTSIASLTIPNSVKSIGAYAFVACGGITSVTIPNSVKSIGEGAFSNCTGLASVTIPNSVKSIGAYAFVACGGITSVTIPSSVTSIGEGAFSGCGITSVTIPSSVTSIGEGAFSSCIGLASIDVDLRNLSYKSVNGVLFNKALTTIIAYPSGKSGSYVIPNSVKSIGESAFSGSSGLTSVTIPNSVTSIAAGTFSGCSGLTSVTIPNSVKSIGEGAFSACTSLASLTIPNSVTSIGAWAFGSCSGLTSVTIPTSVTSIGLAAFSDCFFTSIYFLGKPPKLSGPLGLNPDDCVAYYLPSASGWGASFGGIPTAVGSF